MALLPHQNHIYNTTNIPLTFTVNEKTGWASHGVDDLNVTVLRNATLMGLSDGKNSIVVYAHDLVANETSTAILYFTTDTTPPSISLLSPQDIT
jgi:hypothetical protein